MRILVMTKMVTATRGDVVRTALNRIITYLRACSGRGIDGTSIARRRANDD